MTVYELGISEALEIAWYVNQYHQLVLQLAPQSLLDALERQWRRWAAWYGIKETLAELHDRRKDAQSGHEDGDATS